MRTAVVVGLATCFLALCTPSAFVPPLATGFGVMGDSDADEYRADDNRGGGYGATTLNWVELLARYRGVNVGAWGSRSEPRRMGYQFNWALSGARAADVIAGGQAAGLAQQVSSGEVGIAFLMIGANDFASWNGTYAEVYDGTVSGPALAAKVDAIVADIAEALDIVQAAGPVQLYVATLSDRGNPEDFPDATKRQRVTAAVAAVNSGLQNVAAVRGARLVDLASMTQSLLPRMDGQGNILVGGEPITTLTRGDEPHHFQLSDRHTGTVASGLLANHIATYLNLGGAGIQPFDDTEILEHAGILPDGPPVVALTSPAAGATVSGSVTVSATASDDAGIAGVRFAVDGVTIGTEDTAAPFSRTWNAAAATPGTHVVSAIARDTTGHTATATIDVTVVDASAPTVSITSPAAGAQVSGTVNISASASDNVGVAGVTFYWNGAAIGPEDTQAPFSAGVVTTAAQNGAVSLTAVARDAAGNSRTSSAVNITVNNATPDTTPPTISFTNPSSGASVANTVNVNAGASDNKKVVGVQFRLDGASLGAEDTVSPFSVSWNTTGVTNGPHTLTATARDAAGNTAVATVNVTVANVVNVNAFPSSCAVTTGSYQSGSAPSVAADDGSYFTAASTGGFTSRATVECTVGGVTGTVTGLAFNAIVRSSRSSTSAAIEAFDVVSGSWTSLSTFSVGTSEISRTSTVTSNAARFVAADGTMRVRVTSNRLGSYSLSLERVMVTVSRVGP